jgi:putative transposase
VATWLVVAMDRRDGAPSGKAGSLCTLCLRAFISLLTSFCNLWVRIRSFKRGDEVGSFSTFRVEKKKGSEKAKGEGREGMSKTTVQVRLYPTPEQGHLLMAHCLDYISTVNVLASGLDADLIPQDDTFSTKDFTTALPSAVKNQALRDARCVFKRSLKLDCLPVLKKPVCQWNNQNWRVENGWLTLPVCKDGKIQQERIRCADVPLEGKPGILRIKKKRGKWIADVALTQPDAPHSGGQAVMGVDLGIKVPAVVYVSGKGTRFFGNGRYQRYMRRRFYARRKLLQKAKKGRAVKKSRGKERRWMKGINHKLSRQIVNHAHQQGVGTIKIEALRGIRKGTTRTSRGAKARKNNRMQNTWSFYQLTLFLTYKAEHLGIKVEQVDPAYTSRECPACGARNKAQDRTYVCTDCGWNGHRDMVGAIAISRRAGAPDKRARATGAKARPVDGRPDSAPNCDTVISKAKAIERE